MPDTMRSALEGRLAKLDARMQALEGRMAGLDARMQALERRLTTTTALVGLTITLTLLTFSTTVGILWKLLAH